MLPAEYTIRCGNHTYITLKNRDHHIMCYDNDMEYMETIIKKIEQKTGHKITDIKIIGKVSDFDGLRFSSGFKKGREWLNEM